MNLPTPSLDALQAAEEKATPGLKWWPRPMPIVYPNNAPVCSTTCPWFMVNKGRPLCNHSAAGESDDTCHPMVRWIELHNIGLKRARDSWRKRCVNAQECESAIMEAWGEDDARKTARIAELEATQITVTTSVTLELERKLTASQSALAVSLEKEREAVSFIRELSCDGCEYGDGCPPTGTRHYECRACQCKRAIERIEARGKAGPNDG